jgi:transketolase
MMRAVIGSTVLSPSDAVCAYRLVCEAVRTPGVVYLRMARPKTAVLYDAAETFPIGGSKTLRSSASDQVTVVAAGVTVFEALKAHDILADEGVNVRVIDAYSIKPLDVASLRKAEAETRGFVTVEDHNAWGGLGEAVMAAVRAPVTVLAVRDMPRSGKPAELMARHGIDADAVMVAVRAVLG